MPPKSARLAAQQAASQQKKKANEEEARQLARREPYPCQECDRVARHGCLLCQVCYEERYQNKTEALVLCQGCPSLARGLESIRWTRDDLGMAIWLEKNLEIMEIPRTSNTSSRWLEVHGWKGSIDVDEKRVLDGLYPDLD
jgi:hypothetical protein